MRQLSRCQRPFSMCGGQATREKMRGVYSLVNFTNYTRREGGVGGGRFGGNVTVKITTALIIANTIFADCRGMLFPGNGTLSSIGAIRGLGCLRRLVSRRCLSRGSRDDLHRKLCTNLLTNLGSPCSACCATRRCGRLGASGRNSCMKVNTILRGSSAKKTGVVRLCRNNPKRRTKLGGKSIVGTMSKTSIASGRASSVTSVIHSDRGTSMALAVRQRGRRGAQSIGIRVQSIRVRAISRRVLSKSANCVQVSRFSRIADRRCGGTFTSLGSRKVGGLIISLHSGPKNLLATIYNMLHRVLPRKLVICARSGGKGERRRAYSKGGGLSVPLTILMGKGDTDTSRVFTNTIGSCKVKAVMKVAACKGNIIRAVRPLASNDTMGVAVTGCFAPGNGSVGGGKVAPSIRTRLSKSVAS